MKQKNKDEVIFKLKEKIDETKNVENFNEYDMTFIDGLKYAISLMEERDNK